MDGRHKRLELERRLVHEEQPRQGRVEGGPVAGVGRMVKEAVELGGVVAEEEVDGV